ncbi:uracil-DNA glycosylase [Hydrogenimonas sp.]|uniref:uracil-DNA glycosylase family protein n=1 Tax=Hydrogenimonas sp. TaxID=2231112 RepID=UPI00260F77B0|nr:uracil-DNA glycosylase [Hydrogenimonas sp.]
MLEVHPTWREDILAAFETLDPEYRDFLERGNCLPQKPRIFNAFKTLPKPQVRYILFGQDPYPRAESATGHAFIDGAVETIFSPTGLSKAVNRATSLRNFVKMALLAEGALRPDDLSQEAIAAIDKNGLIDSIDELRRNFERNGVLLLNAALVFEDKKSSARHARAWQPFIRTLLSRLDEGTELILFGGIAKTIRKIPEAARFRQHLLEHPYNHTFIHNTDAHALFGPMRLLRRHCVRG